MYRPQALAAGLLVQLVAAVTARVDTARGPAGAASARADLTHLTAVQPAAVFGEDASFLPTSGAYVARPPANSATYTAYPPYGQYPYTAYPYPYPYPYSADIEGHSTVDTASGDTSRLFGSVASALNPTNLFSCRGGDAGCVVQKIVAGFLIMGAVGLAVYLVYALMNGTLGGLGLGRSADPYSAIWDKMSVLDWIAMLEELYRKFDATSMDCQKRLVCELHQNENSWGSTARKMNNAFSYLQYLELLNLPTDVSMLVDDYLDAANKGRTSQQTCENMYTDCEFSVKALLNKFNGSNAI